MTLASGELRIRPVRIPESTEGSPWLKELYEHFAPVWKEAAKHSESEIDADIDRAIVEVRQKDA